MEKIKREQDKDYSTLISDMVDKLDELVEGYNEIMKKDKSCCDCRMIKVINENKRRIDEAVNK